MDVVDRVEGLPFDPDLQKVTESVDHREAVDLIALAATLALADDPDLRVVRDLNWYPVEDHSVFLAPDVMVVSRSALGERAKSYRQSDMGGGPPRVALEVPSDANTVPQFSAKLRRITGCGVVAYVVEVTPEAQAVLRYEAPSIAPIDWAGQAIPELGGIVLDFVDDDLVATLPDGLTASSFDEIVRRRADRAADDADRRADEADRRAAAAEARAAALEARLRALGHDPEEPSVDTGPEQASGG